MEEEERKERTKVEEACKLTSRRVAGHLSAIRTECRGTSPGTIQRGTTTKKARGSG